MAVPSSGTVHLIGITKERAFDDYDTAYLVPRDVNQLSHPYIITLSRMMNEDQTVSDSISVNISRWNPFSSDTVFQIPADMVSVICEPLPKLKESWEEKVSTEEKVVKELSQPPSENTVIEQELLNEERTDSDIQE